MRARLAMTRKGKAVLALLEQAPPLEPGLVAGMSRPTLRDALERRIMRQGDMARRAKALFAAGEREAGSLLLETGLQAIPDAAPLIGVKLEQLSAAGDEQALEAFAAEILDRASANPDNVEAALWRLSRAGMADGHPLIRRACSLLVDAGEADRAYAALGLISFAERSDPARPPKSDWSEAAAFPAEPFAPMLDHISRTRETYDAQNRLLLLGNSLACGGMERVLAQTYRHLKTKGDFEAVDLALLSYVDGEPSSHYRDEAGVSAGDVALIEAVSPQSDLARALPYSLAGRAQALESHFRETRPRIIHAWNDITGVLAMACGLAAGCPRIVVHFHHGSAMPLAGGTAHPACFPSLFRAFMKREEFQPVFCAEMAARDYARWWSLPFSDAFTVIRNGFDWPEMPDKAAAREKLGLPPDAPIIGTVTRFDPVKQMNLWASAAISCARQDGDAHFLLVGDGPERPEVERRFAEAGLADRVHFAGRVEQTADYYAAMDIFWMTSASEGLPTVCIEAAAAGVPVVAFDVGGVKETVVHGETGMLVGADDVDAMVSETAALIGDSERMARFSLAGADFARTEFSFERYIGELIGLYDA